MRIVRVLALLVVGFASSESINERHLITDSNISTASTRQHGNGKGRVLLAEFLGQSSQNRQIAFACYWIRMGGKTPGFGFDHVKFQSATVPLIYLLARYSFSSDAAPGQWPTSTMMPSGPLNFFSYGDRVSLFNCAGGFHPADLLLVVLRRKSDMFESRSAAFVSSQWKNRNIYRTVAHVDGAVFALLDHRHAHRVDEKLRHPVDVLSAVGDMPYFSHRSPDPSVSQNFIYWRYALVAQIYSNTFPNFIIGLIPFAGSNSLRRHPS